MDARGRGGRGALPPMGARRAALPTGGRGRGGACGAARSGAERSGAGCAVSGAAACGPSPPGAPQLRALWGATAPWEAALLGFSLRLPRGQRAQLAANYL